MQDTTSKKKKGTFRQPGPPSSETRPFKPRFSFENACPSDGATALSLSRFYGGNPENPSIPPPPFFVSISYPLDIRLCKILLFLLVAAAFFGKRCGGISDIGNKMCTVKRVPGVPRWQGGDGGDVIALQHCHGDPPVLAFTGAEKKERLLVGRGHVELPGCPGAHARVAPG